MCKREGEGDYKMYRDFRIFFGVLHAFFWLKMMSKVNYVKVGMMCVGFVGVILLFVGFVSFWSKIEPILEDIKAAKVENAFEVVSIIVLGGEYSATEAALFIVSLALLGGASAPLVCSSNTKYFGVWSLILLANYFMFRSAMVHVRSMEVARAVVYGFFGLNVVFFIAAGFTVTKLPNWFQSRLTNTLVKFALLASLMCFALSFPLGALAGAKSGSASLALALLGIWFGLGIVGAAAACYGAYKTNGFTGSLREATK